MLGEASRLSSDGFNERWLVVSGILPDIGIRSSLTPNLPDNQFRHGTRSCVLLAVSLLELN